MSDIDSNSPAVSEFKDDLAFKTILSRHVVVPLGFGLITAIFFIAIIYYLLSVIRWIDTTEAMIDDSNRLLQLLVDHETSLRGFALTGQEDFLEPFGRAERHIKPTLERVKSALGQRQQQVDVMNSIYARYEQWRLYAGEVIDNRRMQQPVEQLILTRQGKRLMDDMRQTIQDFVAEEQRAKNERRSEAQVQVMVLSSGYFLISLLFSVLMAVGGRRQLYALSSTYGSLLLRQREQTEKLASDAWLYAGESGLANCIITQSTPAELAESVLNFLAEYSNCRLGAVYLAENSDRFVRIADMGLSREMAQRDPVIESGEGLVWQAASRRRIISIEEGLPDYFKISSGLGEATAAALVLVPLFEENSTIAVLELGFTRPLTSRDHSLFERIGDNLGTAFSATRYRQRLRAMLVEMQQLNRELKAQQDELRATNSELEEQSQQLEESQARMESQQSELEEANLTLMSQRRALHEKNEDLTKVQQKLEEHARELERASQHKSEFIASMSHELRTPLNSQLILAQLLAENAQGNLTAEQVRSAKAVYTAGKDLLALINDVLDIAKVEAGKLDVRPEPFQLSHLLSSLEENFREMAREKQLAFAIESDPDVPQILFTDRGRLEQILRNLLVNAIKFTDRGEVKLVVSGGDRNRIRFTVVDTGIGISENDQLSIFEAFTQVDRGNGRKYGGTGLGLSIARQLSMLLGGNVSVVSRLREGSRFTLDIPVAISARDLSARESVNRDSTPRESTPRESARKSAPREFKEPEASPSVSSKIKPFTAVAPTKAKRCDDDRYCLRDGQKTLLVVEDDVEFSRILLNLAHERGYQCLVAASADEALEMANQYSLQAALLDMKLPDHSGLSVLAHFKSSPRLRQVPVHVISVEDRSEVALNMGAIGYLTKPATPEQLRSVFENIEHRLTQQMKKVLLWEPVGDNTHSVSDLIAGDEVELTTVSTDSEALIQLESSNYDCLIIDVEQPDMQLEPLLQRLSSAERAPFPPVVVYAAHALSQEQEDSLRRFSHSIVIKAVRSPERLLDDVMLFLHQCETSLSSEQRDLLIAARSPRNALSGYRILLVDDDVRNVFALTSVLESRGAKVDVARNGQEAVDKVSEIPGIDLVLMDIMMPVMDGYQAMTEIRKQPRFGKLPIIAVTAKANKDDLEHCLQSGASDYVAKPVDVDRLLSLIQVWLPKVKVA